MPAACAQPTPPNLVLVVVDSLRADHLTPYGYERETSPALELMASKGTLFERAYSAAPWTMPSVASILTGQHPSHHGVTNTDRVLPGELTTMAELLRQRGYTTAAVISHHLIGKRFRFEQGFDEFVEDDVGGAKYISTQGVTRKASDFLRSVSKGARREPFFLFVHYFDPHYDYRDHEAIEWASPRAGRLNGSEGIGALRGMLDDMTEEEIAFLVDRYDEEILFTDAGFGRLIKNLENLGFGDDTLVVFTADHGEEFLGRGWLGHMRTLYDELVRVPLLISGPGVPKNQRLKSPVSTVALLPTLLELMGLDANADLQLPESSFASIIHAGGALDDAYAFCEVDYLGVEEGRPGLKTTHKKAVVGPRYKFVRDDRSGELELYDLLKDPGEQTDISEAEVSLAQELEARLDRHLEAAKRNALVAEKRKINQAEFKDLQQLGYAGYDE